ncbi:MAG: SDR family oxidoreductase [Ignavibacteria bacterium]|nr:SDR family oxidoreductase [Ignavibacteria bacterium]
MILSEKVALVTGGARRLGKDISLSLAELGFDIILNYNESSKGILEETIFQIKEKGVNVTAVKCDVSKVIEIKKMFKVVQNNYKKLDLLVNSAAIFKHTDFLETTEKNFEKFINTNLKSTFFCTQEAAKIMLKSNEQYSRIINIASLGGIENWTGYIPYSLSKIGVIKLTELTAKRLAPKILVNAIAPGTVMINNDDNENVNQEEIKKYPMNRFGKSNDITSLIKYLAEDNSYITGQTFVIDGGRSL